MNAIEIAIIIGMFLTWGSILFGLLHLIISDMTERRERKKKKIDVMDIEFRETIDEGKDDKETIDEGKDDKEKLSTYPYILILILLLLIIILP